MVAAAQPDRPAPSIAAAPRVRSGPAPAIAAVALLWASPSPAGRPFVDHGGPELGVAGPVTAPIRHEKYFRMERELFGYAPRYVPAPVSFDAENRPWMALGTELITLADEGRWVALDFDAAMKAEYDGIEGSAFRNGPFISFDRDGDAYMLARVAHLQRQDIFRETPARRIDAFGLAHSRDRLRTWTFYETVSPAVHSTPFQRKLYTGAQRLERLEGHNQIDGPPPMVEGRGWELSLFLAEKRQDGRLSPPETILLARADPPITGKLRNWITPIHSGGGNVSATYGGRTHVVWQSIQPLERHRKEAEALAAEMDGEYVPYALRYKGTLDALAPSYIRTCDRDTGELSDSVLLGFSRRNNHDAPVISVDSRGYLHVVIGAHHDNFQYTRSLAPNSSTEGWTGPRMFGTPRPLEGGGSYTYTALLCDYDDNLHLVSRWAGTDDYRFQLVYLRKKAGRDWEPHRVLVSPFRVDYAAWRQKISIDRLGRLFVSYAYYPDLMTPEERRAYARRWPQDATENPDAPGGYDLVLRDRGGGMLMSDDGGDSWRLAVTGDFGEGLEEAARRRGGEQVEDRVPARKHQEY